MCRRGILLLVFVIVLTAGAFAATPPAQINYQGVLRDASDKPLTGTYDMVFSFWDAASGGSEILDDAHLGSGTGGVTVSNGLFNVALGAGALTDGPGAGTYTALDRVFRDYPAVWLQVQIGSETLSPRTQVIAAAYALNATNLNGQPSSGYLDTSSSSQTKTGSLTFDNGVSGSTTAVTGKGGNLGGSFSNYSGSGQASLANGDDGVDASGTRFGLFSLGGPTGVFGNGSDTGVYGTGYTGVFGSGTNSGVSGYGPTGVYGNGSATGVSGYGPTGLYGTGTGTNSVGAVGYGTTGVLGSGTSYGVFGSGPTGLYGSGTGTNSVGVYGQGTTGVDGYGTSYGVFGAGGPAGVYGIGTSYGVQAYGSYVNGGAAGFFKDTSLSGKASLGIGDSGVVAVGTFQGGEFRQGSASAVLTRLAYNAIAVQGESFNNGEFPGWFQDHYAGSYVAVGVAGYKVLGLGSVSFVQNDPTDVSRQIVYSAPEGDEVAVYTRGSAKLVNGEARVALGPTFGWVTNPDVGLTAHVTPRAPHADLYVASITPAELVVRSGDTASGDAAFDYLVWGLRIGFEDRPVVQPKEHESPIPNLAQDAAILASHPELRAFTASSRHAAMRRTANPSAPVMPDLSRSTALKASIGVYDPARDMKPVDRDRVTVADPATFPKQPAPPSVPPAPPIPPARVGSGELSGRTSSASSPMVPAAPAMQAPAPTWAVSEPVEGGDLLVLDPEHSGELRRAASPSDPNVVGIAAGDSVDADGSLRVTLVDTLYPSVKADATAASIRPGDLLVSAATPGHVMRAPEGATLASIVGKAMQALESGTGRITIRATR